MDRIIRFIEAQRVYVAYGAAVLLSFLLMALNTNTQVQHIRALLTGATGAAMHALSWLPNPILLERENESLRRKNVELADEVSRLREAKLENDRLRALVGLKEHAPHTYLAARVIGRSVDLIRNTVTLNAGTDRGLKSGMAVVTGDGLVGRVFSVSSGYAIVTLVPSRDFRTAVRDQRSRVDGILEWNGRDLNHCAMTNVPKTLDIKAGDLIETSGYSVLFAPGIKTGVIERVENDPATLFYRVTVRMSVDFNRLEEVFVAVVTTPPAFPSPSASTGSEQ